MVQVFEMTLITTQHLCITLWQKYFKSLYFLHSRLSNAELFSTSVDFWFCFSGCKPECGRGKKCVVALWFTEAVLKYGKSEYH